jgi:hypothetical protein
MFMLPEDEFGLGNVVIYKKLQEEQREFVRAAPFVNIRGRIDNEQSGFPNPSRVPPPRRGRTDG